MALGEFTKQLAQQALLSATKDPPAREPPPAPPADNLGATILAQVGAMQKALKEDEELAVYFKFGADTIRVQEIFLPAPRLAVLTFADGSGFPQRVIAPVETLQLVARMQKAKPGAKPHRIALITPKA
jgi:hypothetical protein